MNITERTRRNQRIVELHLKNMKIVDIAEITGASKSTVSNVIKEYEASIQTQSEIDGTEHARKTRIVESRLSTGSVVQIDGNVAVVVAKSKNTVLCKDGNGFSRSPQYQDVKVMNKGEAMEAIMDDQKLLARVESGEVVPSAKRVLEKSDRDKRGCAFCLYCKQTKREDVYGKKYVPDGSRYKSNERVYVCMFNVCPFHELDGISDYREYEDSYEDKLAKELERIG